MSRLSLHNVSKRFKSTQAVSDVSLEIESGEFFSILGPSGCGKTTLLRLVAGFESPTEGSIHLDGRDITQVQPQSRGIGMVFQNYALFPHMTVFQNVAFGLETRKLPKQETRVRVERILETVHMQHKRDVPVPQLSGGEQQRVAVARALVVEPAVLLFDEPLSNLDVALRLSTREEIKALQRRTGITTIYVTHDQSEAMSLSDRIAVMQSGRVVQVGSPSEMYERPGTRFVAEFLGGANILRGTYDRQSRVFATSGLHIVMPDGAMDVHLESFMLAVKPEAITILQSPVPDAVGARIIEREYLGFTTTFVVEAGGVQLRITALSSEFIRQLFPETQVAIKFDWPQVTMLTEPT